MILQTESLTKRYGKLLVVNNLNLKVDEGEIYGFLGPNGAGKSTTIRIIFGLIKPNGGKITVMGKDALKNNEWKSYTGAIIETPAFYNFLSGYENLRLFSKLSKRKVVDSEIEEALKLVGLWGRHKDLVQTYSYGMRQRLGIAQAIVPKPKLLILDEPSLGLDPQGMKDIRDILISLKNNGVTIFLSTHLLNEVEMICSSLGIIIDGNLIYQGKKNELFEKYSFVTLRTSALESAVETIKKNGYEVIGRISDGFICLPNYDDSTISSVNHLLVKEGYNVYEIKKTNPTLEEIFLKMTNECFKNNEYRI